MAIGDKLWLVTKPAGTDLISDIDGYQADNNYAIERMLKHQIVGCNVTNNSDEIISCGAGAVACTDGSTIKFRENTSAVTATQGSGDNDTLGANKWYDVLAVADASVTTFTLEISEHGVSPEATHYKIISMFKTDSSSDIIAFYHDGNIYHYNTYQEAASGVEGTTSAYASADISGIVPSFLSTVVFGKISCGVLNTGVSNISTGGNSYEGQKVYANTTVSYGNIPWRLKVITADTLYYYGGNASSYLWVDGFEITEFGYMR